jgi:hypothetical protein
MPLVTTVKKFYSTVENVAKLSAKVLYYNMTPCVYGVKQWIAMWLNGGFSVDNPSKLC